MIEENLGRKAIKEYLPMQAGDVAATSADVTDLQDVIDWRPTTQVEVGVKNFIAWYKDYYAAN